MSLKGYRYAVYDYVKIISAGIIGAACAAVVMCVWWIAKKVGLAPLISHWWKTSPLALKVVIFIVVVLIGTLLSNKYLSDYI